MALEQWAPRALEQSSAMPAATIQLSANEGTVCETWSLPFPDLETFLEQARAVIGSVAEESPKGKRVPLMFTALTKDGQILTQQPSSCIGRNAAADSMIGAGNNAAKAFAESMTLQVASMNALLTASIKMVESQTKACESLTEQLVDHREYIKAIHEAEIERLAKAAAAAPASGFDLPDSVKEQLTALMPLAQHAGELWLEKLMTKKNPSEAVKAAVAGVTQNTSNGAS